MSEESTDKISIIRLKELVLKALAKTTVKISIFLFLTIALSIGVYLTIHKDNFRVQNLPLKISALKKEEPPIISIEGIEIEVVFTNTIHTDNWELFYNNELIDTFETENGVQASWEKTINVNKIKNHSLLLKSHKGKNREFKISNSKNNVFFTVEGDYKSVKASLQLQNPELPNGCEATSLAMLLSAAGIETDKSAAAQAMPTEAFTTNENGLLCGPDPEHFYAGNPESKNRGFYAFVLPVKKAATQILTDANICLQAIDLSGNDFAYIDSLLWRNIPVMLWITIDYSALRYCEDFSWIKTSDKKSYLPIANLHCVVATGKTDNSYTVLDPIKGEIEVTHEKLKYVYEQMGSRALYIY